MNIGVISYNIYGNFTNYGSALQSWALHQAIKRLGKFNPILVDYCPDILKNKNPLNPFQNMWDKDEESREMCELSLPAIRENYFKFNEFYEKNFEKTEKKYTSENFNEVVKDMNLVGFVCGSDTIFCMDEFGIDDGYYANYESMKNRSVAYAASFGDATFTEELNKNVSKKLKNFNAIGLREEDKISYVSSNVLVPVQRVIDPTLLLESKDYECIENLECLESSKYVLYYSRRFSQEMEEYVEKLSREKGLSVVEISLRATNKNKGHKMYYEAGVEEFLSLVKHAEYVVTNSFHGMIFAVQYRKNFVIFSREQCNVKIEEMLGLFGLLDRMLITGNETFNKEIDYDLVHSRINKVREQSFVFLEKSLLEYLKNE